MNSFRGSPLGHVYDEFSPSSLLPKTFSTCTLLPMLDPLDDDFCDLFWKLVYGCMLLKGIVGILVLKFVHDVRNRLSGQRRRNRDGKFALLKKVISKTPSTEKRFES